MYVHPKSVSIAIVLAVAMVSLEGCGFAGPSHGNVEAAVNAAMRDELQAQADAPLAQLTGQAAAIQAALKAPGFSFGISDQKCNKIGDDKYRCDVLLDFAKANKALLDLASKNGAKSDSSNKPADAPFPPTKQAAFVLTKLGGEWRAEEEKQDQ